MFNSGKLMGCKMIAGVLAAIICLQSCCNNESTLQLNYETVWILQEPYLPDSLRSELDNFIFFKDSIHVGFNDFSQTNYELSGDTIRFIERIFLQLNNRLQERKSLLLEGIITKCTSDTLRIRRIRGIFPYRSVGSLMEYDPDDYLFVNQEVLRDPGILLENLSFASSTCYGTCPEMQCEIDRFGNITFFGGEYAPKTGYFKGKIDKAYFEKIVKTITYLKMDKDTVYLSMPADAPVKTIVVETNKGQSCYYGSVFGSTRKLAELNALLLDIHRHSSLYPLKGKVNFKALQVKVPEITVISFQKDK